MRTQPRHSPCSRPGESQQETTQTQHSGWAAVPAWGAQPCALPQLAKGSLMAATLAQRQEGCQAQGAEQRANPSWGTAGKPPCTPQKTAGKRGRGATPTF